MSGYESDPRDPWWVRMPGWAWISMWAVILFGTATSSTYLSLLLDA